MDRDVRDILIVAAIAAAVLGGAACAMFCYSGMGTPLTVVESGSMQHSDGTSSIGVIDTGDMVLMRDPGLVDIVTYVEGEASGYSRFGDYGDVIIYYRDAGNPVIHRAFLWLDYDGAGGWNADSLESYGGGWDVQFHGAEKWEHMRGKLTFHDIDRHGGARTIDLDSLEPHSGYLTKGDNNRSFDVPGITDGLVDESRLKAVAGMELPWLGCVKLYLADKNVDGIPNNSVPCLAAAFIDMAAFFLVVGTVLQYVFAWLDEARARKEKK